MPKVGGHGKSEAIVTLNGASGDEATDAALIHHLERDHGLDLGSERWGGELLTKGRQKERGWEEKGGGGRHLYRDLTISKGEKSKDSGELRDHIVRFPSAPIYGINRKSDYNAEFARGPTHTVRVLTHPKKDPRPVGRLFIFHNGLNEAENLRFYYRLADWILSSDKADDPLRSACLIAPFSGHLTNSPFPGQFSQTPLLRYLGDSGELFRQFLRYMVEMRWLLSAVNKRIPHEWMVGERPIENDSLTTGIRRESKDLRSASARAFERTRDKLSPEDEARLLGDSITVPIIESTTDALEEVLDRRNEQAPDTLSIHVIGYSLGGFLAQSVFFAWPNMVSSCATICSGGAIRALSPTAFAHPEEWQAVLHTLRPELEESMLRKRIAREGGKIAGIQEDRFAYYQRIFDQVFLQEDHASYKARLSEYGTRMLFIGGGEDPIVRPREVLDASPKEGITMLSVANLTHFLGETARTEREIEQREFWLPEAGGLIARAAKRAEELHGFERKLAEDKHLATEEMEQTSREAERGDESAQAREKERRKKEVTPHMPKERHLESPAFEDALDWVIDGVTRSSRDVKKPGKGWVFVCRNGLPAAFLDAKMRRAWATGLHHHDVFVQKYAEGLTRRAAALREIKGRTTVVLPYKLAHTFVKSSGELVDPHSDAPGYLADKDERQDGWERFLEEWGANARWFRPGLLKESLRRGIGAKKFGEAVSQWQNVPSDHLQVTYIPDVWITVDDGQTYTRDRPEMAAKNLLKRVVKIIAEEKEAREQAKKEAEANGVDIQPSNEPMSGAGRKLQADLNEGRVRIVRVSAAELNPRYRGRLEKSFAPAFLLLAHCAGALVRSGDEPAPAE